jgi:Cu2+-containing amine oxidase
MLDGLKNRVVEVDVVPDEGDVGSESNYYGNGFSTVKRVFTTAKTSVSDYDASKTRTWVMENPNKKHRSTGGNIGYKLGELDTSVQWCDASAACAADVVKSAKTCHLCLRRKDRLSGTGLHSPVTT